MHTKPSGGPGCMDGDDARDRSRVQAVERALDLLVALATFGSEGAHITELSAACGLKLSTCHRLLVTMARKGFVCKHPSAGTYCLGAIAVGLSSNSNGHDHVSRLKSLLRPIMAELACRTQETVNVAILDGRDVLFIDQIESTASPKVRMFAKAGSKGPAYCTGSGKALLAGLEDQVLDSLLEGLVYEKFTSETIDDSRKLRMELQKIKLDGYSLDMGERDVGVRCIASPIRDRSGKTVCAISVAGPAARLTNFYLHHELIALVCDAAKASTERLVAEGYLNTEASDGFSA